MRGLLECIILQACLPALAGRGERLPLRRKGRTRPCCHVSGHRSFRLTSFGQSDRARSSARGRGSDRVHLPSRVHLPLAALLAAGVPPADGICPLCVNREKAGYSARIPGEGHLPSGCRSPAWESVREPGDDPICLIKPVEKGRFSVREPGDEAISPMKSVREPGDRVAPGRRGRRTGKLAYFSVREPGDEAPGAKKAAFSHISLKKRHFPWSCKKDKKISLAL